MSVIVISTPVFVVAKAIVGDIPFSPFIPVSPLSPFAPVRPVHFTESNSVTEVCASLHL